MGAGAFYGALNFWYAGLSLKVLSMSICAGAAGGALFGSVIGLTRRRSRIVFYTAGLCAGAAGGAVWCVGINPGVSVVQCSLFGAIALVVILLLADFGVQVI
jgi:hypothetical protein